MEAGVGLHKGDVMEAEYPIPCAELDQALNDLKALLKIDIAKAFHSLDGPYEIILADQLLFYPTPFYFELLKTTKGKKTDNGPFIHHFDSSQQLIGVTEKCEYSNLRRLIISKTNNIEHRIYLFCSKSKIQIERVEYLSNNEDLMNYSISLSGTGHPLDWMFWESNSGRTEEIKVYNHMTKFPDKIFAKYDQDGTLKELIDQEESALWKLKIPKKAPSTSKLKQSLLKSINSALKTHEDDDILFYELCISDDFLNLPIQINAITGANAKKFKSDPEKFENDPLYILNPFMQNEHPELRKSTFPIATLKSTGSTESTASAPTMAAIITEICNEINKSTIKHKYIIPFNLQDSTIINFDLLDPQITELLTKYRLIADHVKGCH